MIISLLMTPTMRKRVFSQRTLDSLSEIGEVRLSNETELNLAEAKRLLQDADIAVTTWGSLPMSEELLDCAPNLKLIAHAAGSVKPVVTPAVYEREIPIISSAKILSEGVSVTALGFTIAACKDFFRLNERMHQGLWADGYQSVQELCDITIGVVGCGFAGKHYVELMRAFDVEILVYDPGVDAEAIEALGAKKAGFDTLIRNSDVISLHAPSIDATHHMINRDVFAAMKDQAILINTARASLIDTAALVEALENGRLKYACIDVYDVEPLPAENELRRFPNCIMTPHLAGLANNGLLGIGTHVLAEIERLQNNEPLQTEVTEAMLAVIA